MADKTVASFPSGSPALAGDALLMQRGGASGTTYFLTVAALNTYISANLNAVQSITVDSTILKAGTATNPALATNVGTAEGQIPILGDAIKGLAALSNLIYVGNSAMTDPKAPHDAKPIDQVAAELLALIQTAGGVTGISDGTDAATGLVQLLAGSNVTITKHPTIANAFVIAATGGGGGGVTDLNGIAGSLTILPGLNVTVDPDPITGEITIGVQNVNLAATYVSMIWDYSVQGMTAQYDNGVDGVGATLTSTGGAQIPLVDGIAPTLGSRIAVINLTFNMAWNGIYVVTDTGESSLAWVMTRAGDFNTVDTMLLGTTFSVYTGNIYGGCRVSFRGFSGAPITVGTSQALFDVYTPLKLTVEDGTPMKLDPQFIPDITSDYITDFASAAAKAAGSLAYVSAILDYKIHVPQLNLTYDNGQNGVGATLTNSGTQYALFAIDGISANIDVRILVLNMPNSAYNGIYRITDLGSTTTNFVLTRTSDFDELSEMQNTGGNVMVAGGNTYAYCSAFLLNINPPVIGTGGIYFSVTPPLDAIANYVTGNITGSKFNKKYIPELDSTFISDFDSKVQSLIALLSTITPGAATQIEMSADTTMTNNPFPLVVIAQPLADNLKLTLPNFAGQPPLLSVGQSFSVINIVPDGTQYNLEILDNTGVSLVTLSPFQMVNFIVQDSTTSPGDFLVRPELLFLISPTRGLIIGVQTLNTDDIEQLPAAVNKFFTSSTVVPLTQLDKASVPQGSLLYFNGTDWVFLPPGTSGYLLKSNGENANPTWEPSTDTPVEFSWTPVDANGLVNFTIAQGRGVIDGNKVTLDLTVQYPATSSTSIAQINGWESYLNPADSFGVGPACTTTINAPSINAASACTLTIDRINLRSLGPTTTLNNISGQFVTARIEYYLDTSTLSRFKRDLETKKIKFNKAEYQESMDKIQTLQDELMEEKRLEIVNILDSVDTSSISEASYEKALKSKTVSKLHECEYEYLQDLIVKKGMEGARRIMLGLSE